MRPPGMMAHTCNLNTWEAEVGGAQMRLVHTVRTSLKIEWECITYHKSAVP